MKFNNFWDRYNNRVWLPAIVYIFGYFSYDWLTNASHTISQRQTAIQADSPSRWCCWCERSQSCSTFRRSVRSRSKRCSDGWWRRPGHHRISCDSLMIKNVQLNLGVVVMGGDSCSKGCEFETQNHILDGHFSYLFAVKIVTCVWKDENKWKRRRGWPIFLKRLNWNFFGMRDWLASSWNKKLASTVVTSKMTWLGYFTVTSSLP